MRQEIINIYKFDELSDEAKEKARDWYKGPGFEFAWAEEARSSIQSFCEYFGGKLTDWDIGPYSPLVYSHNLDGGNFQGVQLKKMKAENFSPTGYYMDEVIWSVFLKSFESTGSAYKGFLNALREAFEEWRDDMENQLTDEYVDETIAANEYEFTADGKFYM